MRYNTLRKQTTLNSHRYFDQFAISPFPQNIANESGYYFSRYIICDIITAETTSFLGPLKPDFRKQLIRYFKLEEKKIKLNCCFSLKSNPTHNPMGIVGPGCSQALQKRKQLLGSCYADHISGVRAQPRVDLRWSHRKPGRPLRHASLLPIATWKLFCLA